MTTSDIVMVVEPVEPGWWTVSHVDQRDLAVLSRRRVDAAPLRDPSIRCIQRLGTRLIDETGAASRILFLLERLANPASTKPALLTGFPVPILALCPSTVLAEAAPKKIRRFVFLDFQGRGLVALVARAEDGTIVDFARHAVPFAQRLLVRDQAACTSGDLLVDLITSRASEDSSALATEIRHALEPLFATASAFGYMSIVFASRAFDDRSLANAFVRSFATDRGALSVGVLDTTTERTVAGARRLAVSSSGPGVWVSGTRSRPTLGVRATRDVEYHIGHVDRPVFDLDEPALAQLVGSRPAMLFVDRNVGETYGGEIAAYAARHLNCLSISSVEGMEEAKTWAQVEDVCARIVDVGLRRDGVIVAVGGGTTLDVTGLAASLYRRGVRFVRIPTTLIGMVDVCVGIKQGANFASKKNVVGAFHAPFGGINDLRFLKTLPRRYLASGVSEIIKMALIRDPFLFELLEAHAERLVSSHFQTPSRTAEQVVVRAELAMMAELQPNLYEQDLRRFVDFGHSFSPWLEKASDFSIHHGEAVGLDMMMCTAIAVRRGRCADSVLHRLARLYRAAGIPISHPISAAEPLVASLEDVRLHRGGDLNLVVPTAVGAPEFVQEIDVDELTVALCDIEMLAQSTSDNAGQISALAGG